MLEIYGTLGPGCHDKELLKAMIACGMNGVRLNLSHCQPNEAADWLEAWSQAQKECGMQGNLLVDLKGRELRTGDYEPKELKAGQIVDLVSDLAMDESLMNLFDEGQTLLLQDGKVSMEMLSGSMARVIRPGTVHGRCSVKAEGLRSSLPALCPEDVESLQECTKYGVTGVMVPFVHGSQDLLEVRQAMERAGLHAKLYAKIEDVLGADNLEEFASFADMIIIARGDLANDCSLIRLPALQRELEERCKSIQVPYMIVTEMLDSMRNQPVCTRAEANDVYWAVRSGASAIMLTGETAAGKYPLEAMEMFCALAREALKD